MEVEEQYGDQVRFVGIPGLSSVGSMAGFVDETGTSGIPHIPDVDGVIWERFGVSQQRTYVFIDDDGSWRTAGYGSLADDVQALIAQ